MMLKKMALGILIFTGIFVGFACENDRYNDDRREERESKFAEPVTPGENEPGIINADGALELTLEDLSYYDGTDGKRAYVAVDGFIYDMTDSDYWRNGGHNGYQSGQDLTDAINRVSPHGPAFLDRVPKIGIIVE